MDRKSLLLKLGLGVAGLMGGAATAEAAPGRGLDGISIGWSGRGVSVQASFGRTWSHRHCFRRAYDRIWVPPVYRTIHHGYDACGRPIYRQILVQHGYWKGVCYDVCRSCGYRCSG